MRATFSGGNHPPRNSVYGATNKAFDPTPDTTPPLPPATPVSTFSTPMGIHADSNGGGSIKKSEDAISDGRPGSDPMERRDGKSTFFNGGGTKNFGILILLDRVIFLLKATSCNCVHYSISLKCEWLFFHKLWR